MTLSACIITLLIVYPLFLAAGMWFFRYIQKTKPNPLRANDMRTRFVKPWRFVMFVVLLPLALTGALAALGWLDPLFYLVASL